jgi:S1-C subfamily serine protease
MKKLLILIAIFVCTFTASADTVKPELPTTALSTSYRTLPIKSAMSRAEGQARKAAVRVGRLDGGYGSGSVVDYKGSQFVLTAQHVANDILGSVYLIQYRAEEKLGVLVYTDPLNDIALIWLAEHEEFTTIEPMPYKPRTRLGRVGERINYSGYPAKHSLLSFRGSIAGYETHPMAGTQIILNVFGWFGSSGSVIYDEDSKIVGVLWGVDVDYYQNQVNENIVWVTPIQNLDIDLALQPLCGQIPDLVRACR